MTFAKVYTDGDLGDSYYWHAAQSIRRLIDAAAELECDTERLLLEGGSLGGMTVLIVAAADARPKAVISHYAGGHLYRARQALDIDKLGPAAERWRQAFDFLRQPQRPNVPVYIVTASNDEWFALPDQIVTRNRLGRKRVRLAVDPNLDHGLSSHIYGGINAFRRAFAAGRQPDWAELARVEITGDTVDFHLTGPAARFQLVTTDPADIDLSTVNWRDLKWHVHDLPLVNNFASAPLSLLERRIYYGHVTSRDHAVDSSVLFQDTREWPCDLNDRIEP
jgi:dienelactone hydrolase